MWLRALRVIPRIDRAEWDRLDIVSRWLIASRSAVFVLTFTSASIAGLLAVRDRHFDPVLWALAAVALVAAHATNNLLNDLTDHLRGVDRDNYFRAVYGPHTLEHRLLTVRQLLAYAAAGALLALALRADLLALRRPLPPPPLAAGAVLLLLLTRPPQAHRPRPTACRPPPGWRRRSPSPPTRPCTPAGSGCSCSSASSRTSRSGSLPSNENAPELVPRGVRHIGARERYLFTT